METKLRKGAGYSIEAVLAALILFTFAFGAVDSPEGKDWRQFQDQVAARDLTFMIKKTGDLDTFLRNSNTEAVQTEISQVSSRNLRVSGTVENLPLNEIQVGMHKMPSKIHVNNTVEVSSGDRCEGNLVSLDSNSEYPIRRTDSEFLENRHNTRLYFADTDAQQPGGYNGEEDYDAVWVDNGTDCVFEEGEGPYYFDDIFLWGDTGDPDSLHYEFKNFNDATGEFTVYEAPKAAKISSSMNEPLNGIETDTVVDTVNFSTSNLENYDVLVFQENESLTRIELYGGKIRDLMSNTSVLMMMNMTRSDTQNSFIEDVGFKWTEMDLPPSSNYDATFSNYGVSESIETYFLGLAGQQRDISLKPGGKVISNQGSTETSREDVLFARNIQYDADDLDGTIDGTWSTYGGGSCSGDTEADFEIPDGDYSTEIFAVKNVDTNTAGCSGPRGIMIDKDEDGDLEGPFLGDEILIVNGRRYSPNINSNTDARLEFAGSRKVELVNHREVLEDIDGERVARIAYEDKYGEEDINIISSTIYWLRGDTVIFEASDQPSSLSTTVVGGINNRLFMPYRMDLRWVQ